MSQRLNRALSKVIGTGTGGSLRQRLAMTTILAVVPFMGYGRQAYAACDNPSGSIVVCSDTITGDNLNYDNADVSTLANPPFNVTDNGLYIYGDGHIQFHDDNASIINNNSGNGLDVRSNNNYNGTDGAVTIDANSAITGSRNGIFARNNGNGDIDITFDGSVSGYDASGIQARNYGENLTIITGASSNVYGRYDGILAINQGGGDLEVTANGIVHGDQYNGIYAVNSGNGHDLTVTTGAQSDVYGNDTGIDVRNFGDGNLEVEASGFVHGDSLSGIDVRNFGNDLTVETGATSYVAGFIHGINAINRGSGDLNVTARGVVFGYSGNGVYAFNSVDGSDLTITADATSEVFGRANGIFARNYGNGDLEIAADGQVTGENEDGILAINLGTKRVSDGGGGYDFYNGDGHDLTITTGVKSNVTGAEHGIRAINAGDGDLTITANGNVTGEDESGIYAVNVRRLGYIAPYGVVYFGDGHDLIITTGSASVVAGDEYGILARNQGDGDLEITANGHVTGDHQGGIAAYNSFDGHDLTVTTGAGSSVRGYGDGIDTVQSGSGDLDITVGGAVTGEGNNGVRAINSFGAETNITVKGGGLAQGDFTGIYAGSAESQDINIINDGTVRNLSTESFDYAIIARGGAADIATNGVLIGTVTTDTFKDFDDDMENGGFWNTSGGTSDFGGGDDEVTNKGTLLAANDPTALETTRIVGIQKFNNDGGLVSLVDGQVADELILQGDGGGPLDYNAVNGRLAADAVLAPDSQGGNADQLTIIGTTSGKTLVHVNVVNAEGANSDGITVVAVFDGTTAEEDFDLDGPLNAGFFTWDLRKDDGGQEWHELFTSGIGVGSYEFAAGISGGQEVWHQTTGTLLQRQADLRSLLNGTGVTPVADYGETVAPTPTAHITPGFWLRGLGAYIERDDEENGFVLDRKQTIFGGMAGFDFGSEGAGDVWMFGIFGGYITSDLDFTETNSEWTYEGPTVGAYASYLDQGLYADVTVKADFLDVNIDPDDLAPASDDEDTDALNLGARIDAGYKIGETLFIEPQATLAVLHTEIDDVDIFGGTVEFDDTTSFRGRLGLRVGFDHTDSTGTVYSADVTGSAWEDFSGDNEVTIAGSGLPSFSVSDDPGQTIGDASLGFSVASPEGWSGFLRGNYLFGSDYEAVSGNAGVRYAW